MALEEIGVIWAPKGLEPLPSYETPYGYDNIRDAIVAALGAPPDKCLNREPWLRAGVGVGAEIVNRQGVFMLKEIYNEGTRGIPIP